MDFWLRIFYNLDITYVLFIVVSRGGVDEVLIFIIYIAIVPVGIHVPSRRGFCSRSIIMPWQQGGLRNSRLTASLSASQYFNIIVQGLLVCAAFFRLLDHHPRPCTWRVRLPLLYFYPFSLSLELLPILVLYISRYFLDPTLSISLPLPLMHCILPLGGATASPPPPLSPSSFLSAS